MCRNISFTKRLYLATGCLLVLSACAKPFHAKSNSASQGSLTNSNTSTSIENGNQDPSRTSIITPSAPTTSTSSPVSTTPVSTTPSTGSDNSSSSPKNEYTPLVKVGYSGYKDFYNPDTKVVYEGGNALLTTSHSDVTLTKIKLFVPPGTKFFTVSFLTYLGTQESKAVGRFGKVPNGTAAEVTAATMIRNTANILERLTNGEELPFYSPGGSGNLGISEPYQFDTFQVSQGGYIYLHVLSVPGDVVKTLQTRMTIDESCYRSWYAHARWDSQGNPDEQATHNCAGSTL